MFHVHMQGRNKKPTKSVARGIRLAPDVIRALASVARARGWSAAVNQAVRERGALRRALASQRKDAA